MVGRVHHVNHGLYSAAVALPHAPEARLHTRPQPIRRCSGQLAGNPPSVKDTPNAEGSFLNHRCKQPATATSALSAGSQQQPRPRCQQVREPAASGGRPACSSQTSKTAEVTQLEGVRACLTTFRYIP